MRALTTLLRNLVVGLFTLTQNVLKALWVKPPPPDYVTFELRGDPPYRRPSWRTRMADQLAGRPGSIDLHTLSRRFEQLARSEIVRGVVLRVDELHAAVPKLESIREMVLALKARGKEVVFWTPQASTRDALLVLSGNRFLLAPAGRLDLRGFAVEATTAGPALQKAGARAHVFRRGTHKSAGELLSRDGISDAHRETLDHVLDGMFERLVEAVSEGRSLEPAVAEARISEGPYTAPGAVSAGLADALCHGDEVSRLLAEDGREKARLVPWPAYRATVFEPLDWRPVLAPRRALAVVPVRGLIAEGDSRMLPGGLRVCGARTVGERLAEVRRDRSVRAVVLHVDSRGGSSLASDLIWREVRRTAERKPVVAFLDQVAASGGYYCASAADRIVATPTVLTGSIGVLAALIDLQDLYERMGLRRELLARGERAALGTSVRPPTDPERAALAEMLDEVYRLFLERVAEGRRLERETVAERAEGKVYLGSRAHELQLVDLLGGYEDALAEARRLAQIPEGIEVELTVRETGPRGLLTRLPSLRAAAAGLLGGTGSELAAGTSSVGGPAGGAGGLPVAGAGLAALAALTGAVGEGPAPAALEALALAALGDPLLAWSPVEVRG